jgi:hypothetical protein
LVVQKNVVLEAKIFACWQRGAAAASGSRAETDGAKIASTALESDADSVDPHR